MADNTPWKWNYFTFESLSIVKCSLCNSDFIPGIEFSNDLKQHLMKIKDTNHKTAYNEVVDSGGTEGTLRWDSYYKIIPTNIILKPIIQCTYCDMPFSSDKRFRAPKDLGKHLKTAHNIEFKNWIKLRKWIYENIRDYYMPRDDIKLSKEEKYVIKVDTCTKCDVKIGAKNAIIFVKHLINKHRNDINNFPSNTIPKELLPSSSTVREDTTLSSDIADRPGPSGQQGSSRLLPSSSTVREDTTLSSDIADRPSGQQDSSRLLPSSSTVREDTTLSSDIADRPGPSGQQGSSRLLPSSSTVREDTTLSSDIADRPSGQQDRLVLDYDPEDLFEDINTGDSQTEDIIGIETSISSNQLSTSTNLLFEPHNISSTRSIKNLHMMEENLKRMYECTQNTLKSLKKMKKK